MSDSDAEKYIRIFTMLGKDEIESAIAQHQNAPHERSLQKLLAKEVTVMVHGVTEYEKAVEASGVLFGNSTSEALKHLDEKTFLAVFDGVPTFEVPEDRFPAGVIDLLAGESKVFPSKGECRKMIQAGGVSINKEKISDIGAMIDSSFFINGKYILAQKGKKNYFIIKIQK